MPIYEYSCPKCGEFEATQRITEEPLRKCPTCRSKVKKLISNTSFQLKGSGWYVTDYARKGDGKEKAAGGKADAAAKSDSAGDGKGGSSSDTGGSETSKANSKSEPKAAA
jgi:putative FmdB family regulatory protein